VIALPESPDAFKTATWEDVAPYYEDLATRPLDKTNVETWLRDWSDFESMLAEAAALAHFAYACNTADAESERAQLRFGSEIDPKADEQRTRLQRRLVDLATRDPTWRRRSVDSATRWNCSARPTCPFSLSCQGFQPAGLRPSER